MNSERRIRLLKVTFVVVLSLFILDKLIIGPAFASWSNQSIRMTALREKVNRGRQLREREGALRDRWAGMLRANLPAEDSAAGSAASKAVSRWVNASQINLTSFTPQPQWQSKEDGYETLECRVTAAGSQAALGRFIYEMESDTAVPVNLEECELASGDARGAQLKLTARITFLRLKESKN